MNPTVQVLKAESVRLRALAAKIDALIAELDGVGHEDPTPELPGLADRRTQVPRALSGEYSRLTQTEAIIKALGHGPVRLRDLYLRLRNGGSNLKSPRYVSSVIARLKDKVQRSDEGIYSLIINT